MIYKTALGDYVAIEKIAIMKRDESVPAGGSKKDYTININGCCIRISEYDKDKIILLLEQINPPPSRARSNSGARPAPR